MSFRARLNGAIRRRLAAWLCRRPFRLPSAQALVSFTFDDFPRSASDVGGGILEDAGARGTYFVALGLAGQTIATGAMFRDEDILNVAARGHELGCHTYHHCPAWETSPRDYENSVRLNRESLAELPNLPPFSCHSYPISYPRPATKRRVARSFRACRAGGQTFNRGTVDLNHLSSFFLEQSVHDFDLIERTIGASADHKGWLIFSTHDLSDAHTRYGCSPRFFTNIVRAVRQSGARIVTVAQALDELGIPPRPAIPSSPLS